MNAAVFSVGVFPADWTVMIFAEAASCFCIWDGAERKTKQHTSLEQNTLFSCGIPLNTCPAVVLWWCHLRPFLKEVIGGRSYSMDCRVTNKNQHENITNWFQHNQLSPSTLATSTCLWRCCSGLPTGKTSLELWRSRWHWMPRQSSPSPEDGQPRPSPDLGDRRRTRGRERWNDRSLFKMWQMMKYLISAYIHI